MPLSLRICIALILIGIQPFLWGYVRKYAQELYVSQTNEQQSALLSKKLSKAQETLVASKPLLEKLSESFPPPHTISQVLGHIEALADSQHVTIDIQSIEDVPPLEVAGGAIIKRRITASVGGPIDSLLLFLEAVENQKEVVTIDSWEMTRGAQQSATPIFTMTIQVVYYFYEPQTH